MELMIQLDSQLPFSLRVVVSLMQHMCRKLTGATRYKAWDGYKRNTRVSMTLALYCRENCTELETYHSQQLAGLTDTSLHCRYAASCCMQPTLMHNNQVLLLEFTLGRLDGDHQYNIIFSYLLAFHSRCACAMVLAVITSPPPRPPLSQAARRLAEFLECW